MSEETKTFFLESVKSAALLWCNKAISSDDFFKILDKTVNETEKKMKNRPRSVDCVIFLCYIYVSNWSDLVSQCFVMQGLFYLHFLQVS